MSLRSTFCFLLLSSSIAFAQLEGNQSVTVADAAFLGEKEGDLAGHHVTIIGDIDKDGYDDFIITAPGWDKDDATYNHGVAYLFYGQRKGWSSTTSLRFADALFMGSQPGHEVSHDSYGIGDVDNDGFEDFAIAIKKYNTEIDGEVRTALGKVYIFFGGPNRYRGLIDLEDNAGASLFGANDKAEAAHIKGVGDIDGDGIDDIIVGSGFHNQVGADGGKVFIIFGKPRGAWLPAESLETAADASYIAESAGDWAGHRVDGIGDVDNDGFKDFIIGANNADVADKTNNGKVYLILGRQRSQWGMDRSLSEASASWHGSEKQGLGWNVTGVGDVDNDRLADFIISDKRNKSYLLLGKSIRYQLNQNIETTADVIISPEISIWDDIGHDIHSLGDYNVDGYEDFIIGVSNAPDPTLGDAVGKCYLFYGRNRWPAQLDMDDADAILTGENSGDNAGFSVGDNGDVNGDGINDFIIGAVHNSENGENAGKCYLFISQSGGFRLTSPNGGELYTTGTYEKILWIIDPDMRNVSLEYSKDNGESWRPINNNAPNTGNYMWKIPNTTSEQCLVKIADAQNGVPYDISDSTFTIFNNKYFFLLSPTGGEEFIAGTLVDILWSTGDLDESVAIEYSIDGKATWDVIDPVAPNTGQAQWRIPDRPSNQCYIRLYTTDSKKIEESNEFSIYGSEYKRYRVEAEDLDLSPGYIPESQYQSSGGKVASLESDVTSGTITYNFDLRPGLYDIYIRYFDEIHGKSTSTVRIENKTIAQWKWDQAIEKNVYFYRHAGQHSINQNDDLVIYVQKIRHEACRVDYIEFVSIGELPQSLSLTAPNGGETWFVGSTRNIIWDSENISSPVDIELSRDGGTTWNSLATGAANTGVYAWRVSGEETDSALVKVTADSLTDQSDGFFSIQIPSSVTVTSPNGGENWPIGSPQNITWDAVNLSGQVKIELSRDGGLSWETLAENAPDSVAFTWAVTMPPSQNCFVKVSDSAGSVADSSNAPFSIVQFTEPMITILEPNGNDSWAIDSQQQIRWFSEDVDDSVEIELTRDDGVNWELLGKAVADSGNFKWQVTGPPSESCWIRVHTKDGAVSDISNAGFTIYEETKPEITVVSPNGGETWSVDVTYTIKWNSTYITGPVKIELSRDGGAQYTTLADRAENTGAYSWKVTLPVSDACLIKVSSVDESAFDVSDNPFSITTNPTLVVLSPNGGEAWTIGLSYDIRWTSKDINSPVKIELSRDGGKQFAVISDGTENTGSFNWIATLPMSDSCLVKISALDGSSSDVSDGFFSITSNPTLVVQVPNGGENWMVDSQQQFIWSSNFNSGLVKIQITRDNGVTWKTITESTEDDGSFDWQVTGPPSNACLALISDVDGLPIDISNTSFYITQAPKLELVEPNGNEIWEIGVENVISWTSVNISNTLNIELSRDNGETWQMLGNQVENTGIYTWIADEPTSKRALVRISDLQHGISDTSDAVFTIDYPTGVARISSEVPTDFSLKQNYPNPFNPETRIVYQLPEHANVQLSVYTINGRLVATLVDGDQPPGTYMLTWSGQDDQGSWMPSGMYFYRIITDTFSSTKRMILMK